MVGRYEWGLWLYVVGLVVEAGTLDNGLAKTPPMGWLSWERFRCQTDCRADPDHCISERLFKVTADLLASEGYAKLGYRYLVVDDCWSAKNRSASGELMPDPDRFPSGMLDLARYIHSKGLLFGIYGDYGNKTCAGYPGSLGYLEQDAKTFASWEADYVKMDGCYANASDMDAGYTEFGRQMNATGRPMVYSCSWPYYQHLKGITPDYSAIVDACNLWRSYEDIEDSWRSVASIVSWYGQYQDMLIPNAGPGHWNDPDMLIVGNFGLSLDQARAQLAVWAVLAAPLMISADLREVTPQFKEVLQNEVVVRINQDMLGVQGRRVWVSGQQEVWTRPITPMKGDQYSFAVALINLSEIGYPRKFTKKLSEMGLKCPQGYLVKDLFDKSDFGLLLPESELTVRVRPCGVVFLLAVVQAPDTLQDV